MNDWEKEMLNKLTKSAAQVQDYNDTEKDIDEAQLLNCMDIEIIMELSKDKHIPHDRCEEIDLPAEPPE